MHFLQQNQTATIKFGPFLDKTDGVTEESGLTPVVEVSKNGGAFAARNSGTAITHDVEGWYAVELNAVDTNTLGRLTVKSQDANTHLPVWAEVTILSVNVFTSLITATDKLDTQLVATDAGAITGASLATDVVANISDGVWDEARADHTAAGSFGQGVASVQGNVTGSVASVTGTVGGLVASALNDIADAIWDEARADHVAVGSFGEGISISDVTASLGNKIADHILRRSFATAAASADGDAKNFRSLLGAVAKHVNKVALVANTLTVFEADDATALGTQTVTTTLGADPITAVDTD